MQRSLIGVLAACALVCGAAQAKPQAKPKPPQTYQCQAAYEAFCDAAGCKTTLDNGAPVAMSFTPAAGRGDFCTYTYCRPVAIQGALAPLGDSARMGVIVSGGRETPDGFAPGPEIEGVFTLSDKGDSFTILWPASGGATVWGGRCAKAE